MKPPTPKRLLQIKTVLRITHEKETSYLNINFMLCYCQTIYIYLLDVMDETPHHFENSTGIERVDLFFTVSCFL